MNLLDTSGALALLASVCGATTYVVDDSGGPGVDFTNLQTAITSMAAGDVLLIRAGNYGGFTLDKELTLIGTSGVNVTSPSTIANVPASSRVIVARAVLHGLHVNACTGPVLFEDVDVLWSLPTTPHLLISGSADVRFHDCVVQALDNGDDENAVNVSSSRVEFSSCQIHGGDGYDDNDYGSDGGYGIDVSSGSRVHFALTKVSGGSGGDGCVGFCASEGGDGAPAIKVHNSTVILAGVSSNHIIGGAGGDGGDDGIAAPAIDLWSGQVLWSSVTIVSGGPGVPAIKNHAGAVTQVVPPDPTLAITGNAVPGGAMTLTFHGVPGVNGRLQQGNQMLVDDDGLAEIEKLNNRIRIHPLGPVPSSGTISYPLIVPSNWVPGQFRVFQGLEIDAPTVMLLERTNSVPVVVH